MKMRRVLALVMAVLMVIGLMPAISAVQNQEPAVDDYFTVTKTAEATDVPGIYDIKVTVAPKGKVDVVSGDVEVVFLLDTSGSMAWCTDPNHDHRDSLGGHPCKREEYDSRLKIAQNAISNTISSLNTAFQNSGSTLTVSVVTYASEPSVKVDKAVVTNETLGQITKKVSDITSLGGTYMESGLKKASLQFSSGNSSKYLIMIGDGDYDDEDYFDGFLFWGKWNYATDRIKDAASAITKKGATLMTVGFTQDIAIFREIASKDSNGQPMYSRADSDVTLNNILEGITEKISADGIVLEDYVGDNNSIVDTQKVDVDYGVIESSSTNNIKWNIPSGNADKMTLSYRISVDPSKLDAGLNENVPLNGTTKLTYKVAEGDPKEITVQPPTDNLTVAKLYVEYYLDGNLNGDMSRYVDSKLRNDGPATFDFGKPEDTLTVGEGDGAMTYKFEKAVQLDDNDTEIPLAFTDNGTTTVNVYNNIQVVRVYYVTEKPEMPEPPEIMAIVTVKCVNEKAGHEEKAYEVNTGDYTVLNGGVTEVDGTYQYVINLLNSRYLSAYNTDTGAEHRLKENKATEIKFVYEKENGRWTHENPTIKVICESEPEMPEPPEILAMVTVKCVNAGAGHEEKAYEVNTGDYTVLNGGVTEVDGTYQYVINLLNSRYLSAYNTDTGAEHRLKENKATEIKFVYEKENGRWTHENPTIKVICESEPEMPEPPEILAMVTVKCVNAGAGHEEKAYEVNTGDYSVLNGGVVEVDGTYQYVINLLNSRYLNAYNTDTGAEHKLAENKATEIVFTFEKETGRWIHENPTIEVICESETEMPEPPEIMAIVTVKCINEKAGHEEKAYEVNAGDYSVLNGGVVEVDGTYQYVINLLNSRYLNAYNTDTGAEHKLAENKATEIVFTFEKETGRWIHENPTIKVICESEPEMPEPPEIMAIVTVKCVNEKTGHKEKAYEVNAGDYTVLNGGVTEVDGKYQYVINLINARYLNAYNADTGAEHRLKENKATEIKFVYEKENGRWIHENPIIEVICEDMPQYYSAKIVSINLLSATAEKPYDGKPLTKDEFESLEIKVRFTNIENSEDTYVRSYFLKDVTITPVAGQDRTYRISLKLDDNRSWQIDVKFTGYQTQVGVSDNTYGIVGFIENDDTNSGAIDYLNRITTFNYGKLTVTAKDDPIDPPFIVLFPTLEISNKVIAPKNFEKTSFEYDIINVKTGDVEKSVTLKADSSVRVMVTGGTEYMVVPKNLDVPGYIVTTTSTPDSATVTSDKIGNVSVDFTHIYVVGLNTEDHYAYIRGYEDGTIRPEGNITRAEVATIFYRLLSSEALEAFKTTENTFTDVDSDAWYNLSVSTLAKAGVISGYPDGSFNPNGKITRAELVSIATRFFTTIEVGDSKFSDIAGHWAAKAIDEAYIKGIIKGYSDGTFRPDQAVTRAEAMKIVNGILGRPIDTCVLIEGIKLWPDVASDAWYYYVVAEATNAHRYELTTPEKWTEIIVDEIEY